MCLRNDALGDGRRCCANIRVYALRLGAIQDNTKLTMTKPNSVTKARSSMGRDASILSYVSRAMQEITPLLATEYSHPCSPRPGGPGGTVKKTANDKTIDAVP